MLLGLDVSLSVNTIDFGLQRNGIAEALTDESVIQAMIAPRGNHVELAIFEWTGQFNQKLLVDWTVIDSPQKLRDIATALRESRQTMRSGRTAIGAAMLYARDLLATRTHCANLTLDISGDGPNNNGLRPQRAQGAMEAIGIVVNALVIEPKEGSDALSRYFYERVIVGSTAFVETIYGFDSYADAIRRKILRELTPYVSDASPFARQEFVYAPIPNPPAHQAQRRKSHMRRHAANLPITSL